MAERKCYSEFRSVTMVTTQRGLVNNTGNYGANSTYESRSMSAGQHSIAHNREDFLSLQHTHYNYNTLCWPTDTSLLLKLFPLRLLSELSAADDRRKLSLFNTA